MATSALRKLRVALIQLAVGSNKQTNLSHAREMIGKAARDAVSVTRSNAESYYSHPLLVLPECFNSPYGTQYFADYAEEIPGQTTEMLSSAAKEEGVFLIGGSIPERRGDKHYNTSAAFNPQGELIHKYSKAHLFDIDVPGKIRFQESEVLSPGDSFGVIPLCDGVKIGLGICYDIRFAELSMALTRQGCDVLVFPGAFNMTTGPAHWELIQRGRAVDNLSYVVTCSPARDERATYTAWGHSTVVNPWGEVVAKAGAQEEIIHADIDLDYVQQVRSQIPIHYQRRDDMYLLTDQSRDT